MRQTNRDMVGIIKEHISYSVTWHVESHDEEHITLCWYGFC